MVALSPRAVLHSALLAPWLVQLPHEATSRYRHKDFQAGCAHRCDAVPLQLTPRCAKDAGVSRQTIYRNAQIYETFFEENDGENILASENGLLLVVKQ